MPDHPVIGAGAHRYRMRRDWARLPPGKAFGTTHAIGETSDGRILVHHTGPECIFIFSPEGAFLDSWGGDFHAGAHGMEIRHEAGADVLYLAASSAAVLVKTAIDGTELMRLGVPPRPDLYGPGRIYKPTECAVAGNGDIYVADGYGQYWIHRYTAAGDYVSSFGGPGDGPGQLRNPHGIAIDTRSGEERLLVADRRHGQFQFFSLAGEPLGAVRPDVRLPCTAVLAGGLLYVPDLRSRVTILDADHQVVAHLGDWPNRWEDPRWPDIPEQEWAPDRFSSPHHLHVDRTGNLYVVEWLKTPTGAVTKLEKT